MQKILARFFFNRWLDFAQVKFCFNLSKSIRRHQQKYSENLKSRFFRKKGQFTSCLKKNLSQARIDNEARQKPETSHSDAKPNQK